MLGKVTKCGSFCLDINKVMNVCRGGGGGILMLPPPRIAHFASCEDKFSAYVDIKINFVVTKAIVGLVSFVLWCGYCVLSFRSFGLRHL